jgi:hypothetical protein
VILRRGVLAGGLALAAAPAFALDPGMASGHYRKDGLDLSFRHSVALSQDNAEGVLDHPRQLRVLLSDTDVPVAALYGLIFPPVRAMARAGKVRGLLLEFDPADRESLQVTVLAKPDDPRFSLATISLSNSAGLWRRLEVNATRAVGELNPRDDGELAASFSAPVFSDDVQADLKGAAAQNTEQVRILVARAEAVARGDMPAALALCTEDAAAQLRALPPEVMTPAVKDMLGLIRQLKSARRVVVRRETAAVQVGTGDWASLRREGGAWKAAE